MQNSIKISIAITANQALESMLSKVNENFLEGRLSKQELASWILIKFQNKYFEKSIQEIREANKDPIRILEMQIAELKAAKKSGSL